MSSVAPFPAGRSAALRAHPFRDSNPHAQQWAAGRHLHLVRDQRPAAGVRAERPVARRPGIRLTRRGHLALFAVSCLALFGIVLASGAAADAAVGLSVAPATETLVVQQGDSLWSIASELDPGADPRGMVHRIQELNGIGDWPIVPGQRLVVPVSTGGS